MNLMTSPKRCSYCHYIQKHNDNCPNFPAPNRSRRIAGWHSGYRDGYNHRTKYRQFGPYHLGYEHGREAFDTATRCMVRSTTTPQQSQFNFRAELERMTDEELAQACGEYIFLSALDISYKKSENHWRCQAAEEECKSRNKAYIYNDAPAIYV